MDALYECEPVLMMQKDQHCAFQAAQLSSSQQSSKTGAGNAAPWQQRYSAAGDVASEVRAGSQTAPIHLA